MHTPMTRHAAALAIGLSAVLIGAAAPVVAQDASPAAEAYSVRIGFPSGNRDAVAADPADMWALHLGLVDQEFTSQGINLTSEPFLGAAPAINEALLGGSLQAANYADTAGILAKAQGIDVALVAIAYPNSRAWIVVPEGSPILTVEDLRGRKVATIKATFPHKYLLQSLEAHGLAESDIELINMTLPDSEAALAAGQIDAAVSLSVNALRLFESGSRAIDSTDDVAGAAGMGVIVAANSFLDERPDFIGRYLAVRAQAVEWANANRDEALAIVAASFPGSTPEQVAQLYPTFDFSPAFTPELIGRIQASADFLVAQGLAPAAVDVASWIRVVPGVDAGIPSPTAP